MSKLLEKKDIIHIATEIVVLIGITFYFSSKNKKLLEHIEDLSKRIEEQEDIVQKHEKIIIQLVQNINNNNPDNLNRPQVRQNNNNPDNLNRPPNIQRSLSKKSVVSSKKVNSPIKVSFIETNQEQKNSSTLIQDDDSDDESALDEEIAEELQDLEQNSNFNDEGND